MATNLSYRRPLTLYRREDNVELQLEAFEGLAPEALMVRAESSTSREISNEALVAVLRAFVRDSRQDLMRRLLQVLCRRVARRTEKHLDVWGIRRKELREDLTQEILRMLLECVLTVEPGQEFWECRFWTCFDRRTRSLLRDTLRDREEISLDVLAPSLPALPRDASISTERRTETALALEALPEPIRTAFYMRYFGGYQEESSKADEVTVASVLGVTGRTVRNYLSRAEKILGDWRENHALS